MPRAANRWHVLRALAAGAALLALALAPSGAPAAPSTPSASTYVTSGTVNAVVTDSSGATYLGGTFGQIGPRTGSALLLSDSEDQPGAGFPDVAGTVLAAVPDGSGGWFIGGSFTHVAGVARSGLAHIKPDQTLDETWNPAPNGRITALAISGSALYVGGDFTGSSSIGGQSRNRLAKLSTTGTGAADPTWNPSANDQVRALLVDGSDVYVGGDFTGTIGGQSRSYLAKLSATGSGDADPTWNPAPSSVVAALAMHGPDLVVGGFFSGTIGGQSRARIAKLATTGAGAADATWDPSADNAVLALAVSGDDVYAGGRFGMIGGQARARVAKLSATGTGAADATWDPSAGNFVLSLAVAGDSVYAGGQWSGTIGGLERSYIAKLSTTGTGAADATWNANPNGVVNVVATSGSDVFVGGTFTSAGADNVIRNGLARLKPDGTLDEAWDPAPPGGVASLLLSGDDLVVGGSFNGTIGGQPRKLLAKLSTTTGLADPAWDPVSSTSGGQISAMAMSGDDLFVVGSFPNATIGGQARMRLAKLSVSTGAVDAGWNPGATGDVVALALADGALYVGGQFNGTASIGGADRNRLAKLATTGTGVVDATWNPGASARVAAIAISGSDVFVGGSFSGSASIGGQDRDRLAKLSATGTGAADPTWSPAPSGAVNALLLSGSRLYVGGQFTSIGPSGGVARTRVAALSTTGDGAVDSTWSPLMGAGTPLALSLRDGKLTAVGQFITAGGLSHANVALFALRRATISPQTASFAGHAVDAGASAAQAITVQNAGPEAVHLGTVALTGADAGDFALAADPCSGATLAAGASCAVSVAFDPSTVGTKSAALHVPSDSVDSIGDVALSAVATVATPAPPPPPPPPPATTPPPPPPPAASERTATSLLTTRVRAAKAGTIRLRLRCPSTGTTRCRGTIALQSRLPGHKRTSTIARASYNVARGTRAVNPRLSLAARRTLRSRPSITAFATTRTRQSSGATTSSRRRVTILRPA